MRLPSACVVLMMTGSLALAAPGDRGRLSRDLQDLAWSGRASDSVDIIIQGDTAPGSLAAPLVSRGGSVRRRLELIRGLAATVPISSLEDVASLPGVRHVSPDRAVISTQRPSPLSAAPSWPHPPIGWAGPDGRGVGIAVIDSGIFEHDNLAGAVVARADFVFPAAGRSDDVSAARQDPYGHGTHVAGLIAGRPSGSFSGMAPGAHLVSLRVLDERGQGRTSDVIAALDWCVANAAHLGVRVVNLSLGQPVAEPASTDPLAQAVERAWLAGLVVVASAGNAGMTGSGFGTVSSPGHDPLALTVGAVDDHGSLATADDSVAPFSSRGPTRFDATVKPDLVAAGVRLVSLRVPHSTLDRSMPSARMSDGGPVRPLDAPFFAMSGSSMAAAVASGSVARLLSAEPWLTPDDVKARLMRHARHSVPGDVYTRGAGLLDAAAALGETARAMRSPSPSVAAGGNEVDWVHDAASWGDEEAWSLDQLYGDETSRGEENAIVQGYFDDPCLTGDGIIWQTMSGTGVIWQTMSGNGIIWQTMTAEGVIWQTLNGEGVIWQTLNGNGIIWQTMAGETCPF